MELGTTRCVSLCRVNGLDSCQCSGESCGCNASNSSYLLKRHMLSKELGSLSISNPGCLYDLSIQLETSDLKSGHLGPCLFLMYFSLRGMSQHV